MQYYYNNNDSRFRLLHFSGHQPKTLTKHSPSGDEKSLQCNASRFVQPSSPPPHAKCLPASFQLPGKWEVPLLTQKYQAPKCFTGSQRASRSWQHFYTLNFTDFLCCCCVFLSLFFFFFNILGLDLHTSSAISNATTKTTGTKPCMLDLNLKEPTSAIELQLSN